MTQPSNRNLNSTLLTILLVAAIVFGAYYLLNMPDRRTTSEKIGDAAGELSKGITDAGRQLEDRTPAEKIEDAIKDAGKK